MKKISFQLKQFKKNLILLGIVSSFTACGVIPVADNSLSDDDIFFEEQVTIETPPATKTDAEIIEVTDQVIEEEAKPRVSFNNARGYWLAAIEYLQVGEEDDAEWALEQALILKPGSNISKVLLHQIESDAINVLGEDYFEYKIQRGDSLSKLAKDYLNDPLKFYILAKYNDISNPSRLIIGQSINIPGHQPQAPIVAESSIVADVVSEDVSSTLETDVEDSMLDNATELFQNDQYDSAIELLSSSDEIKSSQIESQSLLVKSYYLKAQQLLSDGDVAAAKLLLLKAADIEPDNVQVNMALIDMDESDEAQQLIDQSIKALAANSPIEAYELINRALTIQPNFITAIEKQKEIKHSLTMYYYKHALMAQRRQELDKAVKYWDEVLVLDENNQNAKLYRAKSISLQAKMKKFVSAL